eukprot:2862-Pyramimonas_sp.AAC.1
MSRFYEHLGHEALRHAAAHAGFSCWLLRALLCTYRAPWRAMLQGAISAEMEANGGAIAGCSCATSLPRLIFLAVLKRASLLGPI